MLSKIRCSYYTNNANNELVATIKNLLESYYDLIDFTIFTDSISCGIPNEYAVLPSYYLSFYKGTVVFDNENEILLKKQFLGNNHKILLYKNKELNNVV